jgi:hypothetical protein
MEQEDDFSPPVGSKRPGEVAFAEGDTTVGPARKRSTGKGTPGGMKADLMDRIYLNVFCTRKTEGLGSKAKDFLLCKL